MTKLELAYLAGVVDSDGSISINVDRWRTKKGLNPAYQECVSCAQVEPHAVALLQELFGGKVRREKSRGERRKPAYVWMATNQRAVTTIRALLPFLRIKRRQAEIVLALRSVKERGREANTELRDGFPHTRFLRSDVLAEMHNLAANVRDLNDTRHALSLRE